MSLEKIMKSQIYPLISEIWKNEKILISLENIDINKAIISILKENLDSFFEGLNFIKDSLKPKEIKVIIPFKNYEIAKDLEKHDIDFIIEDFIKYEFHKEYYWLSYIRVMEIGNILIDKQNKINLCINDTIKCYDLGTTFGNIVEVNEDLIGLRVGYKYYDRSILEKSLTIDFDYGDYCVTPILKSDCVVAETKKNLADIGNISCGNCLFCREGLIHLNVYIDNIINNKGNLKELGFISEIGTAMINNNLCTVGSKGSLLALSGIEVFEDIYKEHISDKKCSANVCQSFSTIYIDPKLCVGCEDCVDVCPANCIDGKKGFIHMIDEFECNGCGKCIEACEELAILKSTGKIPKLPRKLTKVGKF